MKIGHEKEMIDIKILNYFADKARKEIEINNNLNNLHDLYKNFIKKIKYILLNKEKIEENIKNLNNEIKNNIDKIKEEYQKLKSNKYDIYLQKCTDELEMDRPILNQLKIDEFSLRYSIIEEDNIISKLKLSLNSSKEHELFREPKREILIEMKDNIIKEISNTLQKDLLITAKKLNKLVEKSKKKKQKILKLKDEKIKIKEFIYILKLEKIRLKQHNQTLNSDNKTLDDTSSNNREIIVQNYKNSEDKNSSPTNNKLLILKDSKKFEEDDTINKKNQKNEINIIENNSKNICTPRISTQLPYKFKQLKSMSLNPVLIEGLDNNIIENNNIIDEKKDSLIENKNFDLESKRAFSEENRRNKKIKNKKKNKIIQNFQNLEDLFETDSDDNKEGVLIDTVIHSDDETILEEKVKPKKSLSKTYKEKIENQIPKINLSLIEFNKIKVDEEIDLYSLQRRNYKENNIEDNIKYLVKKIEKIKTKVKLNYKKAKAMKKFIDDLKNKYILLKKIKFKPTGINSETKYISNNEIIDINIINKEEVSEEDVGSDYLNEDDEISENNN